MKRTDLKTLLTAAQANGTLIGVAVRDKPDAPLFGSYARGELIGCGCCRGPESDRCCCHIHQDAPRGLLPHKCSLHREPSGEHITLAGDTVTSEPATVEHIKE